MRTRTVMLSFDLICAFIDWALGMCERVRTRNALHEVGAAPTICNVFLVRTLSHIPNSKPSKKINNCSNNAKQFPLTPLITKMRPFLILCLTTLY